ncbi:diketogulonate reductase-like aldo/keto reductase [Frondihabitans sp. PhB188]|uniref:aldo/keto reductase n=1 Tax=Frondihabitans sp. PhB188 TaxID=2485200 RepID=UPI000F4600D3|nr:aldo/keto reductase [Frondihabitans sp. PhB188]ROQ41594.1 diketogulonate reductase-like aldo/keto reductase [Frondihabitans sp. PhB188]
MTEILTLNNGVTMPALGLGVFQSAPAETVDAVDAALRAGYRHIDTAAAYRNERQVGEGIRRSGVPRDEVFIETKVWISQYGYDETLHAFDIATAKMGVEQIDLYILHQPAPWLFDKTLEAYRALETLLADGRVRSIGVSNFTGEHLDRLMQDRTVVPAVNQIELHPYFAQHENEAADAALGIVTQAWSPIGGITFYPGFNQAGNKNPLSDPVLTGIGEAHGKSAAQVMLRWHLQQGRSAIPKSVNPGRIAENFAVFDFELTAAELAAIDALDLGVRSGPDPDAVRPDSAIFAIDDE